MGKDPGRWEDSILVLGGLACACYTFVPVSLPGLLTPLIEDFGLSTTQAGLAVGAAPLVLIPLRLVSVVLIDRLGSRATIGIALTGFGLVQIAHRLATDFLGLLFPTLLLGVFRRATTFGLPSRVSELFPPEWRGSSTDVYLVGSQLGPVAAVGLSRPLLEPALGGRKAVFLASGALVIDSAAVW